jgi:hypothetical protein
MGWVALLWDVTQWRMSTMAQQLASTGFKCVCLAFTNWMALVTTAPPRTPLAALALAMC